MGEKDAWHDLVDKCASNSYLPVETVVLSRSSRLKSRTHHCFDDACSFDRLVKTHEERDRRCDHVGGDDQVGGWGREVLLGMIITYEL